MYITDNYNVYMFVLIYIYIYINIYVCMYVCMYVYIRMYVLRHAPVMRPCRFANTVVLFDTFVYYLATAYKRRADIYIYIYMNINRCTNHIEIHISTSNPI